MPACLAHDIDFHQCLEITSEPFPGQPASTFSHFCILPLRVFSCFFFFFLSLCRPQLAVSEDDKCFQVERRWHGMEKQHEEGGVGREK